VPDESPKKAGKFEILGAWLRVWTPPRGVEIPPVPWRRIAIGTGVGAVIVGLALAILVPRIDAGKEQDAAEYAAFKDKVRKDRVERITRVQRARFGDAKALLPASGAPAAEVDGAKRELLQRLKVSIRDDAKARAEAGEIKPATAPPTCVRTPGTPTSGDYGVLDCFVQTSPVSTSKSKLLSGIGYPFRAVVHYDTFTYAWCMTEPVPSDNLIKGEDATATQLPAPCQSKQ